MTFLGYHYFLPTEFEISCCLLLHFMDQKITIRKFFGQFLVFDYRWFALVVSHSAMKKVEKCRLTTLCIKFVKQQNALLMNVMTIAVNYFFLSLLTCSTSLYSYFYSRKNWFNHGFFLDKHYSMGVRGGTNSSGSLGTLHTPPVLKLALWKLKHLFFLIISFFGSNSLYLSQVG